MSHLLRLRVAAYGALAFAGGMVGWAHRAWMAPIAITLGFLAGLLAPPREA